MLYKQQQRSILILLACILTLTIHSTAFGAVFMKLGDIKGEATEDAYKDWIDLLSFDFGVQRDEPELGSIRNLGNAKSRPIRVSKEIDKSSPLLMLGTFTGQSFPEATIEFVSSSGGPFETGIPYLTYKLKDVIVTSYNVQSNSEDRPTEEVAFYYTKIEWSYIPIDPRTGKPGEPLRGGWDIQKNVPFISK